MQLTVTADWTQPTPTVDRIAIAGYTAAVAAVPGWPVGQEVVYEYTIWRGDFEIVVEGHRTTREAAIVTVENAIVDHIQQTQEANA